MQREFDLQSFMELTPIDSGEVIDLGDYERTVRQVRDRFVELLNRYGKSVLTTIFSADGIDLTLYVQRLEPSQFISNLLEVQYQSTQPKVAESPKEKRRLKLPFFG